MQVPDFVRQDVPLARYSTLGVGGRADYFVDVDSLDKLTAAYNFAGKNNLDVLVIGRGSNILFSDRGFRGLVLHMNMHQLYYDFEKDELWVDAGALVSEIVHFGEELGFSGFESFAGLPGTVGGAVYGNAGCYGKQFWDVVEAVRFLDDGDQKQITADPEFYHYRWSMFKNFPRYIILFAKLKFEPRDQEWVKLETKRIRKLRYENQPTQASVGCIFKNPVNRSAGKLIDLCDLKGLQVGQAMISHEHANFFVNLGSAKASDFMKLIEVAKDRVSKKFGILLEEEIIMIGEF